MIDIIGLFFDPPETPEGRPVALAGWHVNVTPDELVARPELEVWMMTPAVFRRVWAGDDPASPAVTVALRFEDAAEALAALAIT